MPVEMTIVSSIVKLLRDDPVASQLKVLNEHVQRLTYGSYLDGVSALEDAVGQHDPIERERLVLLALEYFRQGYSRNEVPWASLCAESVAISYQSLGRTDDAQRWMLRAWERLIADRTAALAAVRERHQTPWVKKVAKEEISRQALLNSASDVKAWVLRRPRFVYEPFETTLVTREHWQHIFLLEAQVRRLILRFPAVNIAIPDVDLVFPAEAQRPVFIISKNKGLFAAGYIANDGTAHFLFGNTPEKLKAFGIKPGQLSPPY
jgi:hypothetical protein